MSKQEWKDTGVQVGHAFKSFGKNFVRSVKTCVGKDDKNNKGEVTVEDGVVVETKDNEQTNKKQKKSTVFNDGSWRETCREFGKSAISVGKSIGHTAKEVFGSDNKKETKDDHAPAKIADKPKKATKKK